MVGARMGLDGVWEVAGECVASSRATVPGLAASPREVTRGGVRYSRNITLPKGDWSHATLVLNGARFCPAVSVDGDRVSEQAGGMTVTTHRLDHHAVHPGASVRLDVALRGLDDVAPDDASRIPAADLWRSNVSSCLWDTVALHVHGPVRFARLVPWADLHGDSVHVRYELERCSPEGGACEVRVDVLDEDGNQLAVLPSSAVPDSGVLVVPLKGSPRRWSPENPVCYRVRAAVAAAGRLSDTVEMTYGHREFAVDGRNFRLNGERVTVRAGSVVWHRWCRDPEARELAFDAAWFERNIVLRLKSHGANGLRFHLGMPPETFLDICDRHGMIVQAEWSFFHGMKASEQSLVEQWRAWLDLCARHPSVCIAHPWNETEGDELTTAFAAIERLCPESQPVVVSHRDVTHVHKYWWSLFENVGVYYDSATQFPQAIMVDEFGGNYLDGNGDPGGYPALRGSYLRFLGPNHTREQRLRLNAESCARVAEYWRRIGAAGFSPFCILGSPEDGNHHFLGPVREAVPKPVWDALTAAYAPVSCSVDIWDRNFVPGQGTSLQLCLFNDTGSEAEVDVQVRIVDERDGLTMSSRKVARRLDAHGAARLTVQAALPDRAGAWRVEAEVDSPLCGVEHPVVSSWRVRTLESRVPGGLAATVVGVPEHERELRAFLEGCGLAVCDVGDRGASLVVGSLGLWEDVSRGGSGLAALEHVLESGRSAVLLDIGPRELGQGYLEGGDLGPLQGAPGVREPGTVSNNLPLGLRVEFTEAPEPESCIHPADGGVFLWDGLDREATWLWNGYRGGLIVPARDLRLHGLSPAAFLALWESRGADPGAIRGGTVVAYELAGFFAFSEGESAETAPELRGKVRFLVDDAPALANAINPNAPMVKHDLSEEFLACARGKARLVTPLVRCGKDLVRTPVVEVTFDRGRLILSQLLTAGRLAEGFGSPGHYGVRPDPAARQLVLNLLARSVVGVS